MAAHFTGPEKTLKCSRDAVQHQEVVEVVRFALTLSAQSATDFLR